jgi:hypothetical protein
MKRTNNWNVVLFWASNQEAKNNRGTFWTNGKDLYSYNLRIGATTEKGTKIAIDYSAPHSISVTTSAHAGYARQRANIVIHPNFEHHCEDSP